MEINIKGNVDNPSKLDLVGNKITVTDRVSFEFSAGPYRKHDGNLIMTDGWVNLYYDNDGWLAKIEIVKGDPMTGAEDCISYLQPKNPLQ